MLCCKLFFGTFPLLVKIKQYFQVCCFLAGFIKSIYPFIDAADFSERLFCFFGIIPEIG